MAQDLVAEKFIRSAALGALDVHFRLDDRNEPVAQDLLRHFELLGDDVGDARRIGEVDDRAFLRSENALLDAARQKRVELRHGLHQLHAIRFVGEALVDLQERNDALAPEVGRNRLAVRLTVHRPFEQDGAEHLLAVEHGRGHDPHAHLVDEVVHLFVR